jgi:2,3-bisphosphoglycerate-dependent phosphoglycerate mutase
MASRHTSNSGPPTRLLLIRHAESQPDPALPDSEWPLSETGQLQADALSQSLESQRVELLYSSPYRRAIETIKPLAAASELEIRIDVNLRERKLTDGIHPEWQGLIRKAWDDLSFALPGCESGLECQMRIRSCIDGLARQNPGRTIAVASHGNAIALYLNSLDKTFGFQAWASMENPDIFLVDYPPVGTPVWIAKLPCR